jgi:Tfp pilus assembly protein PilF
MAYQAFMNGDDVTAQRNYRQVLQSDIRNTDALLGMAAIAARQSRNDDAAGWYGKVLEVEPRNTVALSALAANTSQADLVATESRIKNLIAQQPEAAYLREALGNLYADKGQWPAAQQAYFDAFHMDASNAEYAFNLAVSLDQLGKPNLALDYYKRALSLIPATGSNIDRAQLESRIKQLQ